MARNPLPPMVSAAPNDNEAAATDATGANAPIDSGIRANTQVATAPSAMPTRRPSPSWRTTRTTRSPNPCVPGCSIQAIRPSVSAIAIGSLPPDSASRVRAIRRRMCVKRSVENTATASVDATTAPRRNASSHETPNRTCAASPVTRVLATTPSVLKQRRRHRDLAQTPPRRLQPALVEDQP